MIQESCTGCPLFSLCLGDPKSLLSTQDANVVTQCPFCLKVNVGAGTIEFQPGEWCGPIKGSYQRKHRRDERFTCLGITCGDFKCQALSADYSNRVMNQHEESMEARIAKTKGMNMKGAMTGRLPAGGKTNDPREV